MRSYARTLLGLTDEVVELGLHLGWCHTVALLLGSRSLWPLLSLTLLDVGGP
jgi:hypothetical protein